MLDESRTGQSGRRLGWIGLLVGTLLSPASSRGDGLAANLLVQYQSVEQRLMLRNSDGTLKPVTLSREAWFQSYEATQTRHWGDRLNFFGQLRLSDVSTPGRPDRTRTPYGTLRLIHPLFGLIGSYSPTTTTGSFGPSGSLGDIAGGPSLTVTTRTQQTLLSGYFAPRLLPRVDLSYTRSHRNRDLLSAPETGTNRRANLAYDRGPLSLHGSYTDLARATPTGRGELLQRSYAAGGGLHLAPSRTSGLQLQYDFSQTGRTARDRTRSHSATLNGDLRASKVSSWNLFYALRRTQANAIAIGGDLLDHEGSLLYNHRMSRLAKLTAGGGLRTDRSVEVTRSSLLRYATAVVAADGDLRHGWRGQASAAHTSNWLPGHAPYSVETYRLGTHMKLRQGLELDGDYNVGTNTDTLLHGLRAVRQASLGLRATPLRGLLLTASSHTYQAGGGILRTAARSRASSLDVRWRPVTGLELSANLSRAGALPKNDPRSTTQLYGLTWTAGRSFQAWGTYSRSNQSRRDVSSISQLSGHDVLTARVLANVGRAWNLSAGYNVADPGHSNQTRQVDAAVTKSFGR
jgi:hypothetical protein